MAGITICNYSKGKELDTVRKNNVVQIWGPQDRADKVGFETEIARSQVEREQSIVQPLMWKQLSYFQETER